MSVNESLGEILGKSFSTVIYDEHKTFEVKVILDYKVDLVNLPDNIPSNEIDILIRQVMKKTAREREMVCLKIENDLSRRIDVLLEKKKAEEMLYASGLLNVLVTRR